MIRTKWRKSFCVKCAKINFQIAQNVQKMPILQGFQGSNSKGRGV